MFARKYVVPSLVVLGLAWIVTSNGDSASPDAAPLPTVDPGVVSLSSAGPATTVAFTPVSQAAWNVAVEEADDASDPPVYLAGQRLVRVAPGSLDALAETHGVTVLRPEGRSGYALVQGRDANLVAFEADERVASSVPNATTQGASRGVSRDLDVWRGYRQHQWHVIDLSPHDPWDDWDQYYRHHVNRAVTVAVLDTGVAYETAVRDGVSYTQAPSLAFVPIRAPYDFVNQDAHANDDHQHGTHIATVIAASGDVRGIAPQTGLMPVKVLDETNQGDEFGLVEGILHAVANGADVINMSLSFQHGYVPSLPLQQALAAADDAGIIMVGAAGNADTRSVTWPAASPLVVAVGAAEMKTVDSNGRYTVWQEAPYTNVGSAIDVMAPGGNLMADANRDGIPDGILAETIHPDDPSEVGYWLMAGSSQAAAAVSGFAALESHRTPVDFRMLLQTATCSATGFDHLDRWFGHGAGLLSLECGHWGLSSARPTQPVYASLLPYLVDDYGEIGGRALVTVRWADGSPITNSLVYGTSVHQGQTAAATCRTNGVGQCEFDSGVGVTGEADAWTFTVDQVQIGNYGVVPRAAMSTNAAFDAMVQAIREADSDAMLAWSFGDNCDSDLTNGEGCLASGLSITNTGSGLASIPLGLVMTPELVDQIGRTRPAMLSLNGQDVLARIVDLDGSGLASIPLGLRSFRVLALDGGGTAMALDGSGLASIPLGFKRFTLPELQSSYHPLLLDGSGLASIPLGFKARNVLGEGQLVPLDGSILMAGTALGQQLLEGGWQQQGYPAASVLTSSSAVSPHAVQAIELSGDGQGAVPFVAP